MTQTADALLARVEKGDDIDGTTANDLLHEFRKGYPTEALRPLLRSEDEAVVRSATWIASELGARALPLVQELGKLLTHASRDVRFYAVDAVWGLGPMAPGDLTAKAALAVKDPEPAVRWKAMNFLARTSRERLISAAAHTAERSDVGSIAWLLDCDETDSIDAVLDRLASSDATTRLVAAAAAARIAARDQRALRLAADLPDEEVRVFAREQLETLSEPGGL
jgi:hypothetical protein